MGSDIGSRWAVALCLAAGLTFPTAAQDAAPGITDTCLECHALLEHSAALKFTEDVHYLRGLTCAACHGGDPKAEDMPDSMDPARGFTGVPSRSDIPRLCAQCHSNAAFVRAYDPSLRTDQLAQYRTSVHGQRLRRGDVRVAVCTDCHGLHDIRPATSPLSSVHPLNLPETCARCHSDTEHMQPYSIPTDQLETYRASVHFQTLEAGDLASPTCATCHGNHGAAPPGVSSVERVCGTCHVFQEQLFDQSPHKEVWAGLGLPSCQTCHGNHDIAGTSDALIGTGDESFCVTCHSEGEPAWTVAEEIYSSLTELDAALQQVGNILDQAERAGMEVGEGRMVQASAQERLVKARVDIHALDPAKVEETTASGMTQAAEAQRVGEDALAELAFRRKGLALSLFAIAFVVLSLWLLIRELERPKPSP